MLSDLHKNTQLVRGLLRMQILQILGSKLQGLCTALVCCQPSRVDCGALRVPESNELLRIL